MSDETPRQLDILLVEDSLADAVIVSRAFREEGLPSRITTVTDGALALKHLREPGAVWPDLILMDLNFHGLDGVQILSEIKTDPRLRVLPVLVLTTSRRDEDVARSYAAGANSYLVKPDDFLGYRSMMASIHQFWTKTAARPRGENPRMPDLL